MKESKIKSKETKIMQGLMGKIVRFVSVFNSRFETYPKIVSVKALDMDQWELKLEFSETNKRTEILASNWTFAERLAELCSQYPANRPISQEVLK